MGFKQTGAEPGKYLFLYTRYLFSNFSPADVAEELEN